MRKLCLAAGLLLTACTGPAELRPASVEFMAVTPEHQVELAAGNAEFAAKLYRQLASDDEGNLFFSPWSVSAAFAMAYAGARGQTADEMAAGLEFRMSSERLDRAFQSGIFELANAAGPNELGIANAFWADRAYRFRREYLDTLRTHYDAEAHNVAFATEPEAARVRINDWVADRTKSRIQDLFAQGSIDMLTRLVLTNTVYFKGKWDKEFDAADTREEAFKGGDGRESTAPLMRQTDDFGHHRGDGFQLLEMPYQDSGLSMLIALPDAHDGLPALESRLTGEVLREWMAVVSTREVSIFVPRFELSGAFDLVPPLQALGVRSLFSEEADLSGMDGTRSLSVQSARHEAWVRVDEEGSEAAAATGIGISLTSMPPPPAIFRADHPFLFMILDRVSHSILFLGRMVEPQADVE